MISIVRPQPTPDKTTTYNQLPQVQWLDGKHVVFGMVLHGRELIYDIEEYGQLGGTPTGKIIIKDCGVTPLLPEDKEVHYVNEWITE